MRPEFDRHEAEFVAPVALQGPYDRLYASREDNILWGEAPTHMLAHLKGQPPGARTLDIGCGDGVNSMALEAMGFNNVGVEISALALNGLKNRAKKAGISLRGSYNRADVHHFSSSQFDEPLDAIVSCGLYHCLDYTMRLSVHRQINDLVRRTGLILFSTLTDDIEVDESHGTDIFDLPSHEEIKSLFEGYDIISWKSGIIDDRHPPITPDHQHSILWVVARRP